MKISKLIMFAVLFAPMSVLADDCIKKCEAAASQIIADRGEIVKSSTLLGGLSACYPGQGGIYNPEVLVSTRSEKSYSVIFRDRFCDRVASVIPW